MMTAKRKRERKELVANLLAQDWNVFGTLKFINGRTIGRHGANKLLHQYWNKVDRTFFGNAAHRQKVRVPRWCFAHDGSDSENFHVHFALLAPIKDIDHACCILNAVWDQHHRQTAPLDKNWITPVWDRSEVASYLTREYWRLGSATLLDDLSWNGTAGETMAVFEHAQQQARIQRAASPIWLRQAQQALKEQKAHYLEKNALFVWERS
ncbi:hypothetical protein [Marimonas arenosa]|uniref:Uncharacterized protein n=1 Tax=Marimonas arenosa TaxID=1795305 RepID=A0AAE4B6B2_9RHOB|nr:hypothetical protein [Marimonas arenosa]MDQ2091159.1 hypothetical protein [Marimonas arenosa]